MRRLRVRYVGGSLHNQLLETELRPIIEVPVRAQFLFSSLLGAVGLPLVTYERYYLARFETWSGTQFLQAIYEPLMTNSQLPGTCNEQLPAMAFDPRPLERLQANHRLIRAVQNKCS